MRHSCLSWDVSCASLTIGDSCSYMFSFNIKILNVRNVISFLLQEVQTSTSSKTVCNTL